jgi:hypothetical protein
MVMGSAWKAVRPVLATGYGSIPSPSSTLNRSFTKDLMTKLSDTELGHFVLPHELQCLHWYHQDVATIRARARAAIQDLATLGDDGDFDEQLPKALMLLALLDHLVDGRTTGMIPDYLNF